MELRDVYRHLGLAEFTDREIDATYDAIVGTVVFANNDEKEGEEGAILPKSMTTSLPALLTETNLQAYLFLRQQQHQRHDQAQEQDSFAASSALATSDAALSSSSSSSSGLARQILERLDLLPPSPTDAATTTTTTPSTIGGTTANQVVAIGIDKEIFRLRLQQLASKVDYWQIWPIAVSMGITGIAVGVVNPAMPLVIEQLSLDSDMYGTIVAAFGLAKLLLNIPAAVVTERYGRKPFLTYGSMPLLAIGVGGIGIADSVTELFVLRLLTGTGVALLSTAATLMLTDASTPRNRASSIAPVMSAFSLGMVVGPGLGGYSMEMYGLQHTFAMVGASYLCVGLVNHFLLAETKAPPTTKNGPVLLPPGQQDRGDGRRNGNNASSSSSTLWAVVTDWRDVLTSQPAVRNVIAMNGMYWTTLAGAQMTILPLLLTTSAGYSAVDVGHVYMGMSALQIIGNPVFAAVSDRIGRLPVLLSGTTLMGGSLFYFDNAIHPEYLLPALAVWSCGSSMLSTAPIAYVSDHVPAERRAAAIALLRTAGDVGLLVGSLGTGYLAHATTIPTAMSTLAGLIWTSTAWLGTSTVLRKWSKKTKTV
jgi:MFS family permease